MGANHEKIRLDSTSLGALVLTGYKLNAYIRLGTLPQFTGQGITLIDLHHQWQRIAGIGTCFRPGGKGG